MEKSILSLCLLVMSAGLPAQEEQHLADWFSKGNYSVQVSYQQGGVFKTNDFVKGLNAAGVPVDFHEAWSVRLARQTTGRKLWEQLYGYPRFGIGVFAGDFRFNEIGRPNAVYGFLTGPFVRIGRWSLTYDYAIGLAFNWNLYDPVTNPFNIAIGTPVNAMVEAGFGLECRIFKHFHGGIQFGMTHYSNGGILSPNRGINNHFWKYSLRHDLFRKDPILPKQAYERHEDRNDWIVAIYTGFRKAEIPGPLNGSHRPPTIPVFATGLFGTWHRQLDYKSGVGAGIQLGYNGMSNPVFEMAGDTAMLNRRPDRRRLEFSVYPSYEITFDRFALYTEAGFYILQDPLIRYGPVFYQRIGFKYYFSRMLFASVQIRAHKFGKAQMIEWTTGCRF